MAKDIVLDVKDLKVEFDTYGGATGGALDSYVINN